MKKILVNSLLIGAIIGGMTSLHLANAHAAAYKVSKITAMGPTSYYAKSAKSGYLWDKTHTKRQHNLKNYPKTTWYATGKYTMKSKKNSGVYLQVKNGSGKAKGYVWSGYMKKGVNPANPQGTITDPYGASMSVYNVDDKLNKQLISLFPGTIPDKSLQAAANFFFMYIGGQGDNYTSVIEKEVGWENEPSVTRFGSSISLKKSDNFIVLEKEQVKKQLSERNKNFLDFKGYRIGAYAFPKHSKNYGASIILLMPSN
ncbi:D-alanyl-D-alanine carboxypeptidase [Levilactobacillus cerevisiae]|uniref:D-alanyl-D-alanine carboxypeptidase n=1 Tax=Levilactobacillus cerevisiae TaxID=1704076 RepID=UPI000F7B0171|nr:D-alanyl-D-alanine carboxypeptidase [Levilactobacillus cerevisiae]